MLTEIFLAAAVSVWQAQVERTRVRVVCTDTCIIDWCICTDNLCINTCAPLILIKGLLCSDFCVEFSGVISSLFCASTVSISLVCWTRRCKYTRPLKWGKMLLFESMLRNSFHSFLFTEMYQVHCFPPENQMQDMNAITSIYPDLQYAPQYVPRLENRYQTGLLPMAALHSSHNPRPSTK